MKAIAEIAKTTSIVQKINTLIDIKINLNLPSLIACFDYRLQQTPKWSRFASVNKTNLSHSF